MNTNIYFLKRLTQNNNNPAIMTKMSKNVAGEQKGAE